MRVTVMARQARQAKKGEKGKKGKKGNAFRLCLADLV